MKLSKITTIFKSNVVTNIIAISALLISILTFIYTMNKDQAEKQFSFKLTESRVTNEIVTIEKKDNRFYLNIPITLMVTNTSGITQPLERIDITIDKERNFYFKDVYDTKNTKFVFPYDISAKSSCGFLFRINVPIDEIVLDKIKDLYYLKQKDLPETTNLSTLDDLETKLEKIYIGKTNLYELTRTKVEVDFLFLSASDGINIADYPLLLP